MATIPGGINGSSGSTGSSSVKPPELTNYDAIAAELELIQYDLTRHLTRFIAARASQLQAKAELVTPMYSLQQALSGFNYSTASDPAFPASALESLDQPQSLATLDSWLTQTRHFPGDTGAEQTNWQSLLQQAGFSVPQKVPVYEDGRIRAQFTGETVSEASSGELVWMDPAQRETLATTMDSLPATGAQGVSALINFGGLTLPNGDNQFSSTVAYCLDRAAGPKLSPQEFNQLRDEVGDTLTALSQSLNTENGHLRYQNSWLLKLLENGADILKELGRSKESQHVLAQEQEQASDQRARLRNVTRDWQNAQPAHHGSGRAAVPGTTRAVSFPTAAPTPPISPRRKTAARPSSISNNRKSEGEAS